MEQIATSYGIGTSTVSGIIQDALAAFRALLPVVCQFPTEEELRQTMADFEHLCHMPGCGGALDGTFMKILKPVRHGDSYYCYKQYPAIVVLLCVDARGIITYINAGRPGSMGDAYTWNTSSLLREISNGALLPEAASVGVGNNQVRPYIVADAAFALSETLLKCYDTNQGTPEQRSFNFAVIRTRRVVENAIGRLKGRWSILTHNFIRDPSLATEVALVAAALHNVCERCSCPFEDSWIPQSALQDRVVPPVDNNQDRFAQPADDVRRILSEYVHQFVQAE
ncbi:putative nuclease HARBI1 [Sycon ciliatum]|uniref:putative nuclease HARBI1 n=1 Tax=Sycon ciliatum TaxID=27933 RepID=UPI0031F63720